MADKESYMPDKGVKACGWCLGTGKDLDDGFDGLPEYKRPICKFCNGIGTVAVNLAEGMGKNELDMGYFCVS